MNFPTAVVAGFRNYFKFSGRASRSEYWYFTLFDVGSLILALLVDRQLLWGNFSVLTGLNVLGLWLPALSVAVRRLHDTGRSGWWWLVGLVPMVGGIMLIIWYCRRDTAGPNAYGPDPLDRNAVAQV